MNSCQGQKTQRPPTAHTGRRHNLASLAQCTLFLPHRTHALEERPSLDVDRWGGGDHLGHHRRQRATRGGDHCGRKEGADKSECWLAPLLRFVRHTAKPH